MKTHLLDVREQSITQQQQPLQATAVGESTEYIAMDDDLCQQPLYCCSEPGSVHRVLAIDDVRR